MSKTPFRVERGGVFVVRLTKGKRVNVLGYTPNKEVAAMKRRHSIIILLFMLALSFAATSSYAAEVEIGGFNVDQTSNPSFWAIEGWVRNLEAYPIKGYVEIKFLNANGSIVKSAAAAVNDAQPFESGEVGAYIYRTFSSYFRGVADFEVIFVEVEIKAPMEPLSPVLK